MLGVSLNEYEEMTPRELSIRRKAHLEVKKIEADEYLAKLKNEKALLVQQALLISRWVWAKKITQKDIDEALGVKKTQKEMTAEQMLAQVKMLNTLFGGEVIVNGEEK